MKYRKKPVVIEAFQLFRDTPKRVWPRWFVAEWDKGNAYLEDGKVFIGTLENKRHEVTPGDFVIQGVQGEIYPCKPDIFDQTYEKVEE